MVAVKEDWRIMALLAVISLIGIGIAIAAPCPVTLVCAGINLGVLYCSIIGGLK